MKWPTIFIFFIAFKCIYAQKPQFKHLNVENGLSQNTVNCILKDQRGYVWIGTNDGLNKYDGAELVIYRFQANDSSSLSDNRIYSIVEDREGDIWIGTKNGLNIYNRKYNRFERFFHDENDPSSLGGNFIRNVYEDKRGNIWVSTLGGGLNLWEEEQKAFTKIPLPEGRKWENVSEVYEDSQNNLWVATGADSLLILERETFAYKFLSLTNEGQKPLIKGIGKTMYEDTKGNIWVATQGNGAYVYHIEQKEVKHFLPENSQLTHAVVKGMLEDDLGQIWIGTDGGGINIYDPKNNTFSILKADIHDQQSVSSNAIYTLYRDRENITWVGTFDGGINIFDPNHKNFNHITRSTAPFKGLSHRSVLSFLEDQKGNIWIGTDGGGLNIYNPLSQDFTYLEKEPNSQSSLSSNVITALYMDKEGVIWAGTYMGGLNRMNSAGQVLDIYRAQIGTPEGLRNNNVWALLEDRKRRMWIGTLGGLDLMNKVNGTFSHIQTVGSRGNPYNERITTLYEDKQGKIWAGGKGLRFFNEETNQLQYIEGQVGNILKDYDIRSIYEDGYGNFWIGTEGGGLFVIDRKEDKFYNFTMADGLPSNAIHNMLEDNEGNLWISSNHGITKFRPNELLRNEYIESSPLAFRNYSKEDGLQSNQFSYSAALKTKDGNLIFGGINGFNFFLPEDIQDNKFTASIEITRLKVYDEYMQPGEEGSPLEMAMSETKKLTLSYNQSRLFSLEFIAPNFTASEKNEYAYMLEGLIDQWSYIGAQRSVSFTNLDQGTYYLRLKAANNDGVWHETQTHLEIVILPPFWKSAWAYLLYMLAFMTILLSFRHILLVRERMKNEIKIKDLEKQKVEELNRLKIKFFTNISHEFRTPLSLIVAPLEQVLSTKKLSKDVLQQITMVQRNASRLLGLVNQLLDFRKIEDDKLELSPEKVELIKFVSRIKQAFEPFARLHRINYQLQTDCQKLWIDADIDRLEKILYNLLSNAFKFTPDKGRITIKISLLKEQQIGGNLLPQFVSISVEDSGIGISEERQKHIFERFYQISENSSLRNHILHQGTGIGLAYTKELIELHGGKIHLKSEVGQGSCFRVDLPLKYETPLILFKEQLEVKQNGKLHHFLADTEKELLSNNTTWLNGKVDLQNGMKKIMLIVEDNEDIHEFMRKSFLAEYFQLLHAPNGQLGWETATRVIPDIIISDIMMPQKDGIEFCRELKKDERTCHIPVLLLTANTQEERFIQGLEIGADAYMTKPFKLSHLKAQVQNLIENRKRLQDRFNGELLKPGEIKVESADAKFLKKAIKIIEENMENPEFGVEEFVQKIGMSRSVVYRKFSALTKQSVKEFINMIRLKRAVQLFYARPELSISEVAYSVGFNDAQYFGKKFKKYYHASPSQYIKQQKEKQKQS